MASDRRLLPADVIPPRRFFLLRGGAVLPALPLLNAVRLEDADSTSAAIALPIRSFSRSSSDTIFCMSKVSSFRLADRLSRPLAK